MFLYLHIASIFPELLSLTLLFNEWCKILNGCICTVPSMNLCNAYYINVLCYKWLANQCNCIQKYVLCKFPLFYSHQYRKWVNISFSHYTDSPNSIHSFPNMQFCVAYGPVRYAAVIVQIKKKKCMHNKPIWFSEPINSNAFKYKSDFLKLHYA